MKPKRMAQKTGTHPVVGKYLSKTTEESGSQTSRS